MPTEPRRSAKSSRAKSRAGSRATPRAEKSAPPVERGRLRPLTSWQWAAAAIMAVAAGFRLYDLTEKVLHHDEGVNGMFMTNLFRTGYYHYDPSNFHGPTLYYFGWLTTTLNSVIFGKDGLSTFAIRMVTALFGLGLVWLLLTLRRELGSWGSLGAAALMAVSPGFVFFSRYFIHEVPFAFFTLGVVVAVLRYRETQQPRYLLLASASAALLGATKETWVITVAVWLIAIPCTSAYFFLRNKVLGQANTASASAKPARPATIPEGPGSPRDPIGAKAGKTSLYINAALVFVATWILFYSSFFTNFPQGVYDSVRTFGYWFKTSGNANLYGPTKYFEWLLLPEHGGAEISVSVLGTLGIILAFVFVKGSSRFLVFTAFWTIGITAAYCIVQYKTPWNALSFLLPLIVMGGYAVQQLYRWIGKWSILLMLPALAWSAYQAYNISFESYDDANQGYSYAHTYKDFANLTKEIDSIAAGSRAGKEIGITVMSPEHWPLPWYLRNYPHAGFYSKVVPTLEPIIIAHENQRAEVDRQFSIQYRLYSSHDLRPGNRLYLYLRRDVQP